MLSAEVMTMLLQLERDEVDEVYDVLKHHIRPLGGGRGWRVGASILKPIEPPIISNEDVVKLNGAIEQAAHLIVNQNKPTFNPMTGDFE